MRRLLLVLAVLVAVILSAPVAVWIAELWPLSAAPPELPEGTVDSVHIALQEVEERQPAAWVVSSDPDGITGLMNVLRQGVRTKDHHCGDTGYIALKIHNGSSVTLGILAGHDARFYEYRCYVGKEYGIFRVDRAAFLAALAELGVTGLDEGIPE